MISFFYPRLGYTDEKNLVTEAMSKTHHIFLHLIHDSTNKVYRNAHDVTREKKKRFSNII